MTQPLLERLRKRVPSPDNQTCECAGDKQCDACLIKEAYTEIKRLIVERRFARKLMWSHFFPLPDDFEQQALAEIQKQITPGHLQMINFDNRYKSAILWLM